MVRNLSLMLDKDGKITLTLKSMESVELDRYTMKHFNSSQDVRDKYAKIIEPFMEEHKSFLDDIYYRTGRTFKGSIVITEEMEDGSVRLKKVFYKEFDSVCWDVFESLMSSKGFVTALRNNDYLRQTSGKSKDYIPLFRIGKGKNPYQPDISDYGDSDRIRYALFNNKSIEPIISEWLKRIKRSGNYYDIMREVFSYYDKMYAPGRKLDKTSVLAKKMKEELAHYDDVMPEEPVRYKSGADEEGYPGDLEKNDNSQTSTDEDKVGKSYILGYKHESA